jgi:pyruvate-formate lyase-activating enzyme
LDPALDAEFGQQTGDVVLDGLLRQVELLADLTVGQSVADQREDVQGRCAVRLPCSGAAVLGARATDELLAHTDLVLLDIKSFDLDTYRKLTGGELAPTLNFATRLDRLGVPMWIRYVLVPGWTDDLQRVDALARFVAGLGAAERVDVLPFHKLGASKYEALGIPFPLRDNLVPDPVMTENVRARFRQHGVAAY